MYEPPAEKHRKHPDKHQKKLITPEQLRQELKEFMEPLPNV